MSASITNRVYLPDGSKLYCSDDNAGDARLIELSNKYGDLTLEACYKDSSKSLDELTPFWTGSIVRFFS